MPTTAHLRDGPAHLRVADTEVALEIAASPKARTRGLLGRDGIDGAILITPSSSIHTLRMCFTIDVAYLDKELRVVDVHTMKPNRIGVPRRHARHVLEAEAGSLARWNIQPGTHVSIHQSSGPSKTDVMLLPPANISGLGA
ncbi:MULTISPECIES: DUF192 domain-containing protein [unclassified Streptomyces]|uniref:DUF192 domain-containing protein n=1 Tax=unclassified Streptomyces TaxID=2593676 RepID=UPI002E24A704|nr:DUF192 domain-containing protein [Streptomyces sp. NBC_00963]